MILNFVASLLFRKLIFKALLVSMKTLTNSGDFTPEAASESPPPHPPTRLVATNREL